jgi:hypothetical protein
VSTTSRRLPAHRLERLAGAWLGARVPHDGSMDGRAYFENLIADRLGAGRGQPEAGRRGSFDLAHLRGVAAGLVAAGALDHADMRRILADLERTLQEIGWLTVIRASVSGPTATLTAMPVPVPGAVRPQWVAAATDPPRPVLRYVIPLVGRTLDDGALISLDVWTTMVTVRIAYPEDDIRARMMDHSAPSRWRGWDDRGTQMRGSGGGGTGEHGLYIEHLRLEPGPADHATSLTLLVEHDGREQQLSITLRP